MRRSKARADRPGAADERNGAFLVTSLTLRLDYAELAHAIAAVGTSSAPSTAAAASSSSPQAGGSASSSPTR